MNSITTITLTGLAAAWAASTMALAQTPAMDMTAQARQMSTIPRYASVDRSLARTALSSVNVKGTMLEKSRAALRQLPARSTAIGPLAESQFLKDHPDWNPVRNPNAPQNDVWRRTTRLEGGQIKTHHPRYMSKYLRDMIKDNKAERFLVPDDHLPTMQSRIQNHIDNEQRRAANLRAPGNHAQAAHHGAKADLWRHNKSRLAPLGRTYAELERGVAQAAKGTVRRAAMGTAASGAALIVLIDGGVAIYQSAMGDLTVSETQQQLVGSGIKAGAVGSTCGLMVLAGSNPISLPVFVIGGVTYLAVDYGLTVYQEEYGSSPLSQDEIAFMREQAPRPSARLCELLDLPSTVHP